MRNGKHWLWSAALVSGVVNAAVGEYWVALAGLAFVCFLEALERGLDKIHRDLYFKATGKWPEDED